MTTTKPLFQVHVTDTAAKHEIPVGPAMDNPKALYGLAEKLNLSILRGQLKGWQDARVAQL